MLVTWSGFGSKTPGFSRGTYQNHREMCGRNVNRGVPRHREPENLIVKRDGGPAKESDKIGNHKQIYCLPTLFTSSVSRLASLTITAMRAGKLYA